MLDSRPEAFTPSTPLPIAELLVQGGLLTRDQAGQAAHLGTERGIVFGEAAIALGFVSAADINAALAAHLPRPDLPVVHDAASATAEDIRNLAKLLALRWFKHPEGGRALAVIGAERQTGRSSLVASLAMVLAASGSRTLLIDADLKSPSQSNVFGVDAASGWPQASADAQLSGGAYHRVAGIENLSLVPSDALAQALPHGFIGSGFADLVAHEARRFDIILVDTPAGSVCPDYQPIAAATGAVLIVTMEGRSRVRSTVKMIDICEDLGVRIVGGTMVKVGSANGR